MSSSVGSPTHDESGLGHIRFNDDDSFTVVDSLGSPLHDNMSDDDSSSSSSSSSISSSSGSSSSSVSSSDSDGDKSTDNDATPSPKPPQEVDKQSTSPSVAATSDAKEEHNSNSSANDNYHSDLKLLSTIIESKATRPSQVPWRSLTHKGEDCHERFEELCDDYVADDDDLDLPLWELASVIALQLNKAAGVVGTNEETVSVVDASARTIASSMDAGGKEGTASLPPVNKGKRKLSQEEKQPASMTGETTAGGKKDRKICSVETCNNFAKKGGVCIRHGATQKRKTCSFEGCLKQEQRGGLCFKHGKLAFCSEVAVARERTYKTCSWEDCGKLAQKGGVCYSHGAKALKCSSEGCTNNAKRRGLCKRHGAYAP